jgi:hypothetical protein
VLGILACACLGTIIFLFGLFMWTTSPSKPNPKNFFSLAMLPFAFAAGLALRGLKIASLDTRAKVSALVEKLDADMADLNAKLDLRTHKSS